MIVTAMWKTWIMYSVPAFTQLTVACCFPTMCWIQTSYLTSDCLQIWRCKTYYYFPVALEIFSIKVHSFERYSRSKFSCYELHMLPNEVVCTYLTIQILQGAVQKNHRFESILKYPKCFVGVRIDINRQLWNFCIKCIFASLHQIQVILSKYKYQLTALWLGKSVLKNCTRASTASLFPSIKKLVGKFFITSLSFPFRFLSFTL